MTPNLNNRRWPPAPRAGDRMAVTQALTSGTWTDGPETARVERQMCDITGAPYAVAFNSCTSAIHAAVAAQPTWKVAAPAFTFAGTITGAAGMGRPLDFLDVDPHTLTVVTPPGWGEVRWPGDATTLIAVDLHGVPHSLDRTEVVTDACQSIGTLIDGKHIGAAGTHCWSFSSAKLISAPDGGAVTTDSKKLANTLRTLRDYGIPPGESRSEGEVIRRDGHNWRPSELSMALISSRLDWLPELADRARTSGGALHAAIDTAGLWRQHAPTNSRPAWHKIRIGPPDWHLDPDAPLKLERMEADLMAAGIPTHRWGRRPLHQHMAYQNGQQAPISHLAAKATTCLGTEQCPPLTWTTDEIGYVQGILFKIGKAYS